MLGCVHDEVAHSSVQESKKYALGVRPLRKLSADEVKGYGAYPNRLTIELNRYYMVHNMNKMSDTSAPCYHPRRRISEALRPLSRRGVARVCGDHEPWRERIVVLSVGDYRWLSGIAGAVSVEIQVCREIGNFLISLSGLGLGKYQGP